MVAFQAVDPGSIPGHRKCLFLTLFGDLMCKNSSLPEIETSFHQSLTVGKRVIHCATGLYRKIQIHENILEFIQSKIWGLIISKISSFIQRNRKAYEISL